jgi:hypothetical protein
MLALNFPNSAPAPTPGYDEGMEGGLPDSETAEYGPQPGLSPTDALGPAAGSSDALLATLLKFSGGDPAKLLSMLQQLIAMLSSGLGANPTAPPSAPLDPLSGPQQLPLPF